MIERTDNNVALERIFDEVYNLINDARHIPLTGKIMLDESDLADIMDDLRDAIPKEIKTATQILEEQKNIINKAYSDADMIVQQAKTEAENLVRTAEAEANKKVQEEEIVKQANALAEDVKANALRYQEEVKTEADEYAMRVKQDSLQYCDDMLAYIGNTLDGAMQSMRENRDSISSERQTLYANQRNAGAVEEPAAPVEE